MSYTIAFAIFPVVKVKTRWSEEDLLEFSAKSQFNAL